MDTQGMLRGIFPFLYFMSSYSRLTLSFEKSYGKAKFQVNQISNFITFLDSAKNTDNWKYHSFLKIPSGTLSKMRAKFAAVVVFILKE